MTVSMCVLLWTQPGKRDALVRYEDTALGLIPEHGDRVVRRVPTVPERDQPDGIQFLEFGTRGDMAPFTADRLHPALVSERDAAITRTEILFLADPLPE